MGVRSGIQCYLEFIRSVKGENVVAFPPQVEWLQAWALLFRCKGTFSNYLGYAKTGCLLAMVDTSVFKHPAVKRAKASIAKSGRFSSREKLWIRRERIEAILKWAEVMGCPYVCVLRSLDLCLSRRTPRCSNLHSSF